MAEGRNLFDTVLGIASLTGLLAGGIWYATGLQNQLDAAQREITELRSKLEVVSTSAGSALRGPKGEKGDQGERGDQGPRGERGPQGEMGPMGPSSSSGSINEAEIRQLVQQLVQQQIASTPSGGTIQVALGGADVFNSAGCIPMDSVRNSKTLLLRKGQEFCESDGRLIARVSGLTASGHIYLDRPGETNDACVVGNTCRFRWLSGKQYVYERFGEDDKGPIALFRLKGS